MSHTLYENAIASHTLPIVSPYFAIYCNNIQFALAIPRPTLYLVARPVHTIKIIHQHVISVSSSAMVRIPMDQTATCDVSNIVYIGHFDCNVQESFFNDVLLIL